MASDYVWTVRDPNGELLGAATNRYAAVWDSQRLMGMSEQTFYWLRDREWDKDTVTHAGYTLTREPLTPSPVPPVVCEVDVNTPMPAHFLEYVERNYRPNTVISNPAWHAGKLWRAALCALRAGLQEVDA